MHKEFIALPLTGKVLSLKHVPEEHFASGSLGPGFAVQFSGDKLYAPFDGTVIATFPTGHAFILRRADGLELLMHVGIGSAKLPQAFSAQVKKYQQVECGEVLTLIKPQFFDDATAYCPVVFSNPEIEVMVLREGQELAALSADAVKVLY